MPLFGIARPKHTVFEIILFFVAEEFTVVQKEVSDLLKGRILVGHALRNDLKVGVDLRRLYV